MLEASRAACAVSRISATSRRKAGVAAGAEAAGVSPASIDGLEYCDRDPGVIPHSHTHCNCPAPVSAKAQNRIQASPPI